MKEYLDATSPRTADGGFNRLIQLDLKTNNTFDMAVLVTTLHEENQAIKFKTSRIQTPFHKMRSKHTSTLNNRLKEIMKDYGM